MTASHEQNRLLNLLIEGSIGRQDFARLQNLLRNDAGLRRQYYELMGIDKILTELYAVPDAVAPRKPSLQSVKKRPRRAYARAGWAIGSLAAAAAVAFMFLGGGKGPAGGASSVRVVASADSQYVVEGDFRKDLRLEAGEQVVLRRGVFSIAFDSGSEACFEAPARLRLLDHRGGVELSEGSGFIQVSGKGGVEIHTPSGVVRDIGTKFGVRVGEDGAIETHVEEGLVDIERPADGSRFRVQAGGAVAWTEGKDFEKTPLDVASFVRSLPTETTVFLDEFDDPDDTRLNGKKPGVGQPWTVHREGRLATVIRGNVLDTSFGPRAFSANFLSSSSPSSGNSVYLITFSTRVPEQTSDKSYRLDAEESLTLVDKDGAPVFSLAARASRRHSWQLRSDKDSRLSIGTDISALSERVLTLSYESDTGSVRLYEGSSPQSELLDELSVVPGAVLRSILFSNEEGGDLAIGDLSVKRIDYSAKN